MLRNISSQKRKLTLILIFLQCSIGIAQTNLVCVGEIETSVDFAKKQVKPESLNVNLDIESNILTIEGNWGCVYSMLTNTRSPDDWKKCSTPEITVTENNISTRQTVEGSNYKGNYGFVINRNSGSMKTSSLVQAKPNSGAKWTMFLIDGVFNCKKVDKQF